MFFAITLFSHIIRHIRNSDVDWVPETRVSEVLWRNGFLKGNLEKAFLHSSFARFWEYLMIFICAFYAQCSKLPPKKCNLGKSYCFHTALSVINLFVLKFDKINKYNVGRWFTF